MSATIAVIQFPGSNCERETALALQRVGMTPVEFLWNQEEAILRRCDGFVIVGGFSYEDRARAGVIAAQDPVLAVLKAEVARGKPLIGICNGAQILVETGLVPGAERDALAMALAMNKRVKEGALWGTGYYNEWVYVTQGINSRANAFNGLLQSREVLRMPVAHGEGRYVMPASTLALLEQRGLIAFQYCDEQGVVHDEFPVNPNGSMRAIAGVCNRRGNVLALMPHPERSPAGDVIFASMGEYIRRGNYDKYSVVDDKPLVLDATTTSTSLAAYQPSSGAATLTVSLLITDNEAVSVTRALQQLGIAVTVSKQIHWEILGERSEALKEQLIRSGELLNTNKEVVSAPMIGAHTASVLVRQLDDMIGKTKQQLLSRHMGIAGIDAMRHGVLWHITPTNGVAKSDALAQVLETRILFNPFAQQGYYFHG